MITYRPRDAIAEEYDVYPRLLPAAWFVIYEVWAKAVAAWQKTHVMDKPLAALGEGLWSQDHPRRRLAVLFSQARNNTAAANFLRSAGIHSWAKLGALYRAPGWRPRAFADATWFGTQVKGRRFHHPGPNEFHPDATYATAGSLRFSNNRWVYQVTYGYPHESSTWGQFIRQRYREGREHFAGRVDRWLADNLVDEDSVTRHRRMREVARWHRSANAAYELFRMTRSVSSQVADAIALTTNGEISMTPARLRTLTGWAKLDGDTP